MKLRIVLSCIFALALVTVVACVPATAPAVGDSTADDDPATADGIGTSPSACVDACDPEGLAVMARLAPDPSVAPPSCGLWFDVSSAAADARALACTPPDALVHTAGHSTCSDAIAFASLHGGDRTVVRQLAYNGAALAASCP